MRNQHGALDDWLLTAGGGKIDVTVGRDTFDLDLSSPNSEDKLIERRVEKLLTIVGASHFLRIRSVM